jgi:hypothetical protein
MALDSPLKTREDLLSEYSEREIITTRISDFEKRLHTVMIRTPEEERAEIERNLGVNDVTRRWASLPFNSGMLVLSQRFRSCLRDATALVRRNVPNIAHMTSEQLQRTPQTEVDFAKLVATKILLVNAGNPGQYLRDGTIPDLYVQLRNCVEALRTVRLDSGSRCSGFGDAAAQSSRPVVPLRNYGKFFS